MKIAVIGLPDFPLGKKSMVDARLRALEDIMHPSKTTFISLELLDFTQVKDAGGIICEKDAKLDLIINDLEIVENRLTRVKEPEEIKFFTRVKEILEKNICISEENFNEEEKKVLANSNLASAKPIFFVDKSADKPVAEIMLESYYAFGMICFITGAKDKELRAWPIKKGATAPEAAGAIHSDLQRGFIKAEIIGYDDVIKAGNLNQAKQSMHLEGKEYVMQDADTVNFRFNV